MPLTGGDPVLHTDAASRIIEILGGLKKHEGWGNTLDVGMLATLVISCVSFIFLSGSIGAGTIGIIGTLAIVAFTVVGALLAGVFHRKVYIPHRRKALLEELRKAIDSCPPTTATLEFAREKDPSLFAWAEAVFDIAQILKSFGPFDPDRIDC